MDGDFGSLFCLRVSTEMPSGSSLYVAVLSTGSFHADPSANDY